MVAWRSLGLTDEVIRISSDPEAPTCVPSGAISQIDDVDLLTGDKTAMLSLDFGLTMPFIAIAECERFGKFGWHAEGEGEGSPSGEHAR